MSESAILKNSNRHLAEWRLRRFTMITREIVNPHRWTVNVLRISLTPFYKEINADRQPLLRERVYHNSTAFASVFCAAARSGMGICMRVTRGPRASGWGSHVSPPFYRPPLSPEGAIFTRGKARSKEVLRRKRRGLAFSLLPLFEKEISILE